VSWFKVDDRFLDHPKFVRAERLAGSTAIHLWFGLIGYCKQHRTDGWVPLDMLNRVNGPCQRWRQRALAALLEVVLVERDGDRLHLHDFLDWNPSRQQIEHPRKGSEPPAESAVSVISPHGQRKVSVISPQSQRHLTAKSASDEPKQSGHLRVARPRAGSDLDSDLDSDSDLDPPVIPPAPAAQVSEPLEKKTSHQRGKRICPADFEPTPAVLTLASELGYSESMERTTRATMVDWSLGKAVARADWQATYRNWLRTDAKERGLKPVVHDAKWRSHQAQVVVAAQTTKHPVPAPRGLEARVGNLFG